MSFPRLEHPVVGAPMGGGPTTPALAAAVSDAGGLGFLAAGYLTAERVAADLAATRELTAQPVGVNLFVPGPDDADDGALAAYRQRLAPEAARLGAELGAPRWSEDDWATKLEVVLANAFLLDHAEDAPRGYPQVHYVTAPLRAVARAAGDADSVNLWADQAYPLAEAAPAGELVRRWSAGARAALAAAAGRL